MNTMKAVVSILEGVDGAWVQLLGMGATEREAREAAWITINRGINPGAGAFEGGTLVDVDPMLVALREHPYEMAWAMGGLYIEDGVLKTANAAPAFEAMAADPDSHALLARSTDKRVEAECLAFDAERAVRTGDRVRMLEIARTARSHAPLWVLVRYLVATPDAELGEAVLAARKRI